MPFGISPPDADDINLESVVIQHTGKVIEEPTDNAIQQKIAEHMNRTSILRGLLLAHQGHTEQKFDNYVDLGLGEGAMYKAVNAILNPQQVHVANIFSLMLKPNNKQLLSFADDSVDLITACLILHHISSPERVLGEISRIMKRGGYLLIKEHDVNPVSDIALYIDFLHIVEFVRCGTKLTTQIQNNLFRHYWSFADLTSLLEEYGFCQVAMQKYPANHNSQRMYYALFEYHPSTAVIRRRPSPQRYSDRTYSIRKNNLVEWIRTEKSEYKQLLTKWIKHTMKIPLNEVENIIINSPNDIDFCQKLCELYQQYNVE